MKELTFEEVFDLAADVARLKLRIQTANLADRLKDRIAARLDRYRYQINLRTL